MAYYEYRHIVDFSETNLVGNVYYAHHVRWQGTCREMILREKAPKMLREFQQGLAFVTLSTSCNYYHELAAFDEVCIRMRLVELSDHRLMMDFEYWRQSVDGKPSQSEELVARGTQEITCMRRIGDSSEPAKWPAFFVDALAPYRET